MNKTFKTLALAALAAVTLSGVASGRGNKSDVVRNINIFNSVFRELNAGYVDTLDASKTMRTAINAMLGSIDPYTEFYPADEQEELLSLSSGQYAGIGSFILKRGDHVIIHQPQWGSPARTGGLRHGDRIIAIDGDTLKPDVTTGAVSKKLKGQPGTVVRIDIERPYVADSALTFNITRANIKVNPMPYKGVLPDGTGYIRLTTFNEASAREVRNAVSEMLRDPQLKGIVLDLRNNGGGLLESAVQIVSNFVPKGTEVVRTRGRDRSTEKIYKTTTKPQSTDVPLVILTNENTASASEIVAGALQDLDRAVVVGDRSYGKGLVQTSRQLPYDALMKLTVGRYYIPSGRLIQAIDYSHRNADGSPARIPDSLTNVFYTAHKRPVRDGGGITPDVKVDLPEGNRLLYNIVNDFWAYDFANRYAADHPTLPPATEWEVDDSLFNAFKQFIDPARFKYDRMCESGIKYLREAAENEGYMNDSVKAQFDVLEAMLKHDLNHDLEHNRDEIIDLLDGEIGDRYYSDGDLVMRSLKGDMVVDSARAIIADKERYRKLLRPAPVHD